MYNICLTGHKWAALVSVKSQVDTCMNQNDYSTPQHVKTSFIT